jgi:hypothetical protein
LNFRGRNIDTISFWEKYVSFPHGVRFDESDVFAPKTQCPNPAHDTLKSHFQINLSQPTVHCFALCGISGSYEHAVCVIEGLYDKFKVEDAPDARERRRRTDRAIREARKLILRNARTASANFSRRNVNRERSSTKTVSSNELQYESFLPQRALAYLDKRGITNESVAAWQLGWLPDEKRLVIPAKDENNRLKFLIKRAVLEKQSPKYLYTEGFPKTSLLFGACALDLGMVSSYGLILVEGSIGTILNHQDGLRNTVAILGTGISESQRRIIARINPRRIYFMFDKDSAGIRNIEIAAGMLRKYPQYVVRFPRGKNDWDEITRKEKLRQLERAVPAFQFLQRNGLSVSHTRRRITVG